MRNKNKAEDIWHIHSHEVAEQELLKDDCALK